MTVGQDNAIATPAAGAEPKTNSFQRIIGVLFSPDATFASIARRPDWVVPLVLLLLVSLAAGVIIAPHVDFGAAAREAMEQNKNASPEQIDKAVRISASIRKVFTFIPPVLNLNGFLLLPGLFPPAFRIF